MAFLVLDLGSKWLGYAIANPLLDNFISILSSGVIKASKLQVQLEQLRKKYSYDLIVLGDKNSADGRSNDFGIIKTIIIEFADKNQIKIDYIDEFDSSHEASYFLDNNNKFKVQEKTAEILAKRYIVEGS